MYKGFIFCEGFNCNRFANKVNNTVNNGVYVRVYIIPL